MAKPGMDFAQPFGGICAREAGKRLAADVSVSLNPSRDGFVVKGRKRTVPVERRHDPAELARDLQSAVDVVMGLAEVPAEGGAHAG